MSKPINAVHGGIERAVAELRRFHVPVYGTFVFGCDADTPDDFQRTVQFTVDHGFLLAAFAHLMPFPGTALHRRPPRASPGRASIPAGAFRSPDAISGYGSSPALGPGGGVAARTLVKSRTRKWH